MSKESCHWLYYTLAQSLYITYQVLEAPVQVPTSLIFRRHMNMSWEKMASTSLLLTSVMDLLVACMVKISFVCNRWTESYLFMNKTVMLLLANLTAYYQVNTGIHCVLWLTDLCCIVGPITYISKTDSIVTCSSKMCVESYKYHVLAASKSDATLHVNNNLIYMHSISDLLLRIEKNIWKCCICKF